MNELVTADIRRLEAFLAAAQRVGVVVHKHPDGDAVGSGAALLAYLRRCRGIQARLLLPDPLPAALEFLLPADGVVVCGDPQPAKEWLSTCDLVCCLDMSGLSRAGILEETLRGSNASKILIDHHLHPEREAFDLVFSETEISSASELLYHILLALPPIPSGLPAEVLTPLMAGMTTDTNNFANSVYPSTLRMASALLAAGVDRDALLDRIYNSYRENRFRAMGAMLAERLVVRPDGVAWAVLDRAFLERFDLQEGETEGFVNLPLGIASVRLSLLLREDDGHFRVSIRSKEGVSANRLATESFHGGGHERAAGGKILFPEDIASPDEAGAYIDTITARFMRNSAPSDTV